MVVRREIVHLLKIVLAGKRYFQKCPPALSLNRVCLESIRTNKFFENAVSEIEDFMKFYKTAEVKRSDCPGLYNQS